MTTLQDSSALVLGATAFVTSAALSGLVRRYALARSLLDVPNERSSHSVPTPRGGGLAIALVVLVGLVVLAATGLLAVPWAIGLVGGGALVAAIGWLDDLRGLPASWRLVAHAVAAAWTVSWLGGMPRLTVGAEAVNLGHAGGLLAVLGVVWAINLYNFMDGIDGLAATEAVTVGLVGALLLAGRSPGLALVAILLASAAAGFLCWNWPLARLFMGDVGSGFLGFVFGGLAVASEHAQALPALLWLVLLGPFFADTTITLLRRMVRGERWHAAHRSHAYQRAVEAGWSHRRVTVTVAVLSAGLGLLGSLAVTSPGRLGAVLALAATVLGVLYLVIERCRPLPPARAGEREGGA